MSCFLPGLVLVYQTVPILYKALKNSGDDAFIALVTGSPGFNVAQRIWPRRGKAVAGPGFQDLSRPFEKPHTKGGAM